MFLLLSDKNVFSMYFTLMDFMYFLSVCVSLMQSSKENIFFKKNKLYIFTEKEVENNCNFLYIFIK